MSVSFFKTNSCPLEYVLGRYDCYWEICTHTHNHKCSAWSNFGVYEKGDVQSHLNKKCKNVTAFDILSWRLNEVCETLCGDSFYHTFIYIHASFSDFRLFWRSQESGERKRCVFIILNGSQLNILPDARARSQICLHEAGQIIHEVLHRRRQFCSSYGPIFCSQQLIRATSLFRICTDLNAETCCWHCFCVPFPNAE